MTPEQSRFLKLIQENSPEDKTPAEKAKEDITRIFKDAGFTADYKTFQDEVTVAIDGVKVVLSIKNVIQPEGEEVDGIEDQEMRVDDQQVKQAKKVLDAAETITGINDPRRRMMGVGNPKKNVEKAVGDMYNKVAKKVSEFAKQF